MSGLPSQVLSDEMARLAQLEERADLARAAFVPEEPASSPDYSDLWSGGMLRRWLGNGLAGTGTLIVLVVLLLIGIGLALPILRGA